MCGGSFKSEKRKAKSEKGTDLFFYSKAGRGVRIRVRKINLSPFSKVSTPGGGTKIVRIRDDAGGHDFGAGDPQNRGRHFNDEAGNHYDY